MVVWLLVTESRLAGCCPFDEVAVSVPDLRASRLIGGPVTLLAGLFTGRDVMVRWVVFSGKLVGGRAPLIRIVTVPRVRDAPRLPLRVLRIAERFRSHGSTVVRLDRRLGAGLLFARRPTPLPAPVVGARPIRVVFPLSWLIAHDDSLLAAGRRFLSPKVLGSLPHAKQPEAPQLSATSNPERRRGDHTAVCRHVGDNVRSHSAALAGVTRRAAVDALTQRIGVARVAGILPDKVDDDVARLGLLAVDVDRCVEVQIGVGSPGMCDLTAPGVPRFRDDPAVGHDVVEVQVRVLLGAVEPD